MPGFSTKVSFTIEAGGSAPAWPSAAPIAGAALLPLLSENVQEVRHFESPSTVNGFTAHEAPAETRRRVSGPVQVEAVYEGLEPLWACALGHQAYRRDDTVPGELQPYTIETGAYRHRLELDPWLHSRGWEAGSGWRGGDGLTAGDQKLRRGTLVIDKVTACWEFLSAMVTSLSLAAARGRVVIGVNAVAHSLDRSSAVNTDLSGLGDPGRPRVLFHHLIFRLAAFSTSSALASGNALNITALTVLIDNHLSVHRTDVSGLDIEEPARAALPTVSGTLSLPRYEAETLLDWHAAGARLMADVVFTGGFIGDTSTAYALKLFFPTVYLTGISVPIDGPGFVGQQVTWRAFSPDAAAAGMPPLGRGGPLLVELVNGESTHALV